MNNKITENYKKLLDNYNVINRVKKDLEIMSEVELLKKYKSQLNEINSIWSYYSGDDIGHAHTCVRLMINCLENCYHIKYEIDED